MKKYLIGIFVTLPFCVIAKVPNEVYYMEAGVGGNSLNYYNGGSSAVGRIDGGFNFNQYVSIQGGLNDYFNSTIKNQNGTFNVSGYGGDISVLPNIPLGENAPINIFLRLGGGYDVLTSTYANQSNFVDVLGAGIRYDISAHLTTSLQWMGRGLLTNPGEASYSSNSVIASLGIFF